MRSIKRFMLFVYAILLIVASTGEIRAITANRPVYNSGINECKKIALTFDDGPHPQNTPKILKILDKYDVKATFFVIGVNVKNYPDALSLINEKGHEIGNHTYSHSVLKSRSKDEILKEISEAENEIGKITDFSTTNYLNEIEKCQYFFFRSKFEVFNIELPSENDFAINKDKQKWALQSA